MDKYNDIKAHLYTCKENNGYSEFENVFDFFCNKNKNKIPKWLLSKEPSEMEFYNINKCIFEKYLVRPIYYSLSNVKPEFERRDRRMKL
jgi:hypothetical protein